MLRFSIHLNTVDDFRSYANLMCRFPVAGYVEQDDYKENMYYLMELMSNCPLDRAELVLTSYRGEDVPEIKKYLYGRGLIRNGEGELARKRAPVVA